MDPATIDLIAKIIKTAVDLTPTVIKTVEDAKPFAIALYETFFHGKQLTADEITSLEARVDDLASQLQEPLPPEAP